MLKEQLNSWNRKMWGFRDHRITMPKWSSRISRFLRFRRDCKRPKNFTLSLRRKENRKYRRSSRKSGSTKKTSKNPKRENKTLKKSTNGKKTLKPKERKPRISISTNEFINSHILVETFRYIYRICFCFQKMIKSFTLFFLSLFFLVVLSC